MLLTLFWSKHPGWPKIGRVKGCCVEYQQPEGFCEEDRWAVLPELCPVVNKSLGNDNSVMFLSATHKENGAAAHAALLGASVCREWIKHTPEKTEEIVYFNTGPPKKCNKFIRVSTKARELLCVRVWKCAEVEVATGNLKWATHQCVADTFWWLYREPPTHTLDVRAAYSYCISIPARRTFRR